MAISRDSQAMQTTETNSKLDRMMIVMQKFLDNLEHIDARFDEKTDATWTAQLETRLRTMEDRMLQLEGRVLHGEEMLSKKEENWAKKEEESKQHQDQQHDEKQLEVQV